MDVNSKSIESFTIIAVMSCRLRDLGFIRPIQITERCIKKMGLITVIHVLFTKKMCVTERVFILINK